MPVRKSIILEAVQEGERNALALAERDPNGKLSLPRWRRHLQVLQGAADSQNTGAFIAVLMDRELHKLLKMNGHHREWAFLRILADGHEVSTHRRTTSREEGRWEAGQ